MSEKKVRHLLGISGGKDSAALAIYLKQKRPEIDLEYFFADTDKELPETYEFLSKLEAFLGKPISRINADRGFDHWLQVFNGMLPSSRVRWCTRMLKLRPFEEFVGDDECVSYVAIRADEDRDGYISAKENIRAVFPFKEDGIVYTDVIHILEESGVGMPAYYNWRSRSGCYFCFFQRKSEWIGLKEHHPDLFEKAKAYEKIDYSNGKKFTWSQGETLDELAHSNKALFADPQYRGRTTILAAILDEDEYDDQPCLICTL